MLKIVTEGKNMLHDEQKQKFSYDLEPGLYPYFEDRVKAKQNWLVHSRNIQLDTCIKMTVSGRTQKFNVSLVEEKSRFLIWSLDLGHLFERSFRNDMGFLLLGKRHQRPFFAKILFKIIRLRYTPIVSSTIKLSHKRSIVALFSFLMRAEVQRYHYYRTLDEIL